MQKINKQAYDDNKHNKSKKLIVEKALDDFCIIEGNKIEGNACSTILNQE